MCPLFLESLNDGLNIIIIFSSRKHHNYHRFYPFNQNGQTVYFYIAFGHLVQALKTPEKAK